jgi:hypothetical protein
MVHVPLQAQAMALADAEVFRQKEALQELKAGYLKVCEMGIACFLCVHVIAFCSPVSRSG